jgi:uncharacterized protein YprB with RNaseH-like and TPR domain
MTDDADRAPLLPPPDSTPVRLLGLPGAAVAATDRTAVRALVEAVAPDAVVATPPEAGTVVPAVGRAVEPPVLAPGRAVRPETATGADGARIVALAGDAPVPDTDGPPRCVVGTGLSLSVEPHERETTVEGVADHLARLPDGWRTPRTAHLSTRLRAGFATTVAGPDGGTVRVAGLGRSTARLGVGADGTRDEAAVVAVHAGGVVDARTVDPAAAGLAGLDGVGDRRAATLREAGYAEPADLATARPAALAELSGFGRTTAARVHAAARARTEGRVVPTGDEPLPDGEPVLVDVETDGLAGATPWLVGVLDGADADDGDYLAFRARDPDDDGHLDAFLGWLTGSAAGRPVVAWNGHRFDFPVLAAAIRRSRPDRLDDWRGVYRFDPLRWAAREDNAALPGRSDRLEAVATALGWTPATTGIDGERVARVYVDWRRRVRAAGDPAAVDPPDWERLERYCEDDVRALAHVYEALRAATRREPVSTARTGGGDDDGDGTTQGVLSEFGR